MQLLMDQRPSRQADGDAGCWNWSPIGLDESGLRPFDVVFSPVSSMLALQATRHRDLG